MSGNSNDKQIMSEIVDIQPAVFVCAECDQIIGDSYSLLEKDANFIVLRSTSDGALIFGQSLHVLKHPYDGCTFLNVSCMKCKIELGCVIKSTSEEWDHYKNSFHLPSSKLKEFQLGATYGSEVPKENNNIKYNRLEQVESILLSYHHRLKILENELSLLKQQRIVNRSPNENSNYTPPHEN